MTSWESVHLQRLKKVRIIHGVSYIILRLLTLMCTVRRAFRQRALQTHPDKLGPDVSEAEKQAAEAKFHEVSFCSFAHGGRQTDRNR